MSWTDRVVEYPNRVKLTAVSGQDNTFNMEAAEGTVYVEGTLLNAENLNNETMNLIGNIVADGWSSSKSYSIGDSCIYNNMLWNCLVANTNMAPTEGTYWTRVQLAKADYVVERNVVGDWITEKWASGKYEAWYRATNTGHAVTTAVSNGWYRTANPETINLPSGFKSIKWADVQYDWGGTNCWFVSITAITMTQIQYYFQHLGSGNFYGNKMCHVVGTWK